MRQFINNSLFLYPKRTIYFLALLMGVPLILWATSTRDIEGLLKKPDSYFSEFGGPGVEPLCADSDFVGQGSMNTGLVSRADEVEEPEENPFSPDPNELVPPPHGIQVDGCPVLDDFWSVSVYRRVGECGCQLAYRYHYGVPRCGEKPLTSLEQFEWICRVIDDQTGFQGQEVALRIKEERWKYFDGRTCNCMDCDGNLDPNVRGSVFPIEYQRAEQVYCENLGWNVDSPLVDPDHPDFDLDLDPEHPSLKLYLHKLFSTKAVEYQAASCDKPEDRGRWVCNPETEDENCEQVFHYHGCTFL
ncbi:MAG: hypothetical protein EA369_10020 [Bradymonadales bacterium]|nr:MAG: hypothetical protein EA369_10020 [Bradymonadales bacterium]